MTYATQGSNPSLPRAPGRSATHTFEPRLGQYGTAFYHCIITATTVGYGDVAMTTPEAKLFACLHIVVSVSWLASLIGWLDKLGSKREAQLTRAELILNPPDLKAIMKLDHDKRGVDELEFVVGMLMSARPSPPLRLSRLAVTETRAPAQTWASSCVGKS